MSTKQPENVENELTAIELGKFKFVHDDETVRVIKHMDNKWQFLTVLVKAMQAAWSVYCITKFLTEWVA